GHSRVFRWSAGRQALVHPLQVRALELWHELENRTGRRLLSQVGCVYVGPETDVLVAQALAGQRAGDASYQVLDPQAGSTPNPRRRVQADEVAVLESKAGVLDPEAVVSGVLEAAGRAGAEFHFEEPMTEWAADSEQVEVVTASARYRAESLVLCLGPW